MVLHYLIQNTVNCQFSIQLHLQQPGDNPTSINAALSTSTESPSHSVKVSQQGRVWHDLKLCAERVELTAGHDHLVKVH